MTDILHNAAPARWIGKIKEEFFIEIKGKEVFNYREKKVIELFGE